MTADNPADDPSSSRSIQRRMDLVCDEFEAAWQSGRRPHISFYLGDWQDPHRSSLLAELLALDLEYRVTSGERPSQEEYEKKFPEYRTLVGGVFRSHMERLRIAETPTRDAADDVSVDHAETFDVQEDLPDAIGSYIVRELLGSGGFGNVYLAYDHELDRSVAIKVPRRDGIPEHVDVEVFKREARLVASLDHPQIVPVYHVGRTEDGLYYVVSKLIDGTDLKRVIKTNRLSFRRCAELVAAVAEALHYAHTRGLVHRDIKPANILIDSKGKPFVADFGLALNEEIFGAGSRDAGTPEYMSPEQARGEGHLVDGRADVFSLGIVFYELLTGHRPFSGSNRRETLIRITTQEARPPRQCDDAIPRELERICLKSLSKRAIDRYSTAQDMAADLRHFLRRSDGSDSASGTNHGAMAADGEASRRPAQVVPKGLRSFDKQDADFFLELLPGPRDRDGIPDSIRFWKMHIEELDPDRTFRVGLTYGPSGCGKSSLIKAGLLPRLADHVATIYIESTASGTEELLLRMLRKTYPRLPAEQPLSESLAKLRLGHGLPAGSKLLIVLDQFEQWLHATPDMENSALVEAVRHCDGGHVQCLVMVRDDFWMATTRFFRQLEVSIVEGGNSVAVDLFDRLHARNVLAKFGQSLFRLPPNPDQFSSDENAFLDMAIRDLAQDDKIVPVRLALFAEMAKGRPWDPDGFGQWGGTEGVAVTFLEETFSAFTAPPEHRLHEAAARRVLALLLPESGVEITGHMRSYTDLLVASGYRPRPRDFHELLRILDSETRLLTPVDPEAAPAPDSSHGPTASPEKYYRLTHDYLVRPLREWLTGKQAESWRGRAELRLAERAALWSAKPEPRRLPSWWEFVNIRCLTGKQSWKESERAMMRTATKRYVIRATTLAIVLLLAGWGTYEYLGRVRASGVVENLLHARITNVPEIATGAVPYRRWSIRNIKRALGDSNLGSNDEIKLRLALLALNPDGEDHVLPLYDQLFDADAETLQVLREALAPYQGQLVTRLWKRLGKRTDPDAQRFRAACVLAEYDSSSDRWEPHMRFVADRLIREIIANAGLDDVWTTLLNPVRDRLLAPLGAIYVDPARRDTDRLWAGNILARFAHDNPIALIDFLVMNTDEQQFNVLFSRLRNHTEPAADRLREIVGETLSADASEREKEELARRQANAAVALLRLDQEAGIWQLLRHGPDPRRRSYLIHRLASVGVDPSLVIRRLRSEEDISIRRGLILSLGEYLPSTLSQPQRSAIINNVVQWYHEDDDPGIHAATEWLLRTWKLGEETERAEQTWADEYRQSIKTEPDFRALIKNRRWYVNSQGHTLIIFRDTPEFLMGSPESEADREEKHELQHRARIDHWFALSAKQVTVEQYRRFAAEHAPDHEATLYVEDTACPVNNVSWYLAAHYCNWLSEQEEIPKDQWCYLPNEDGEYVYAQGLRLADDYLDRTGYRLPTEMEWEYACRANAVTKRYYGDSEELLGKYAWYIMNSHNRSLVPVGTLKPNDFGLFGMHGNLADWCQEAQYAYADVLPEDGQPRVDVEYADPVRDDEFRMIRGGKYSDAENFVRCAARSWYYPSEEIRTVGIRPARTIPRTD